jgi:hypothetical protein
VRVIVADRLGAIKVPSGLLIMNLEWPALKQLLAGNEWLSYRWVILSGFLERQWDQLQGFLPPAFHLRHRVAVDGWLTVTISRGYPQ